MITTVSLPPLLFISLAIIFSSHNILAINAMKVVIQRVKSASVTVNQKQISTINHGILALVGLHIDDTENDLQYCAKRLLAIKLWENDNGAMWRQHIKQKAYDILCVSQFTLYGTLSKKNQPDYKLAMKADQAQMMYNQFLDMLKLGYDESKIHDGAFGEMMDVALINDGPVTLVIDSRVDDKASGIGKQMSSMSLTTSDHDVNNNNGKDNMKSNDGKT